MNHDMNNKNVKDYSICSSDDIIISQTCFKFVWVNKTINSKSTCIKADVISIKMENITLFKQLFSAISLHIEFPSIILEKNQNIVHKVTFQRYLNKLKYECQSVPIAQASGFYPCNYRKVHIWIGMNLKQCSRGGYILSQNVCDRIKDCPNDESDEDNCICPYNKTASTQTNCKITHFGQKKRVCSELYYITKNGKCQKFIRVLHIGSTSGQISNKRNTNSRVHMTSCNDGRTIPETSVNDLILDCHPDGEDETKLMSSLMNQTYSLCV